MDPVCKNFGCCNTANGGSPFCSECDNAELREYLGPFTGSSTAVGTGEFSPIKRVLPEGDKHLSGVTPSNNGPVLAG